MLDTLIRNATIVDGSGGPKYAGSVGIQNGKIVMDPSEEAGTIVDGSGLTLCPGFIDSHSHHDQVFDPAVEIYNLCKISQGVTTDVVGQCGMSPFPVPPENLETIRGLLASFDTEEQLDRLKYFTDFEHFLAYAESLPKASNFAFNCGHSVLRAAVMGTENRRATPAELEKMKAYLKEAMEHGCFGLTSGLIYIPGVYSDTQELIELCKVIQPYGGVYATHMRNESDGLAGAVKEAIYIAETAGVPLFISHHKAMGVANWGLSKETLRLVHAAIDRGVKVTIDQYPYLATQTVLNVCLPPQLFAQGKDRLVEQLKDPAERKKIEAEMRKTPATFENNYINCQGFSGIVVLSSPNVPEAIGMSVADYAKKVGKSDFDAFFDLMVENHCEGLAAFFAMDEKDLQAIYMDENTVVGSDGIITADTPVHPRTYGTFAKAIAYFCKDKKLLTFEQAVRKQTSLTAERWGLKNKGLIAGGYDADLVLLDAGEYRDSSDFVHTRELAKGVKKVFVNGEVVFEDGKLTQARPGKCILRSPK